MTDGYGSLACYHGWACESVNFPPKPATTSTDLVSIDCSQRATCKDAEIYCPDYAACQLGCGGSSGDTAQCQGVCVYLNNIISTFYHYVYHIYIIYLHR